MGFDYLQGENWSEITRDERTFCFDIVHQLNKKENKKGFIKWICRELNIKNVPKAIETEIAAEVCFYRDILFKQEIAAINSTSDKFKFLNKKKFKGLLKRTFDICIFLPNDIIIIEAKGSQGFTTKQMIEFKYDRHYIQAVLETLGKKTCVHMVALSSEEYENKFDSQKAIDNEYFDKSYHWADKNMCKFYEKSKMLKSIYTDTQKVISSNKKLSKRKDKENNEWSSLINTLLEIDADKKREIKTAKRESI